MPVTIPDDIVEAAHITEPEIRQELALALFQQERLTLAQASRLAAVSQVEFQRLLAQRHVPVHYGPEEFDQDLKTLHEMGRL
jgi:predicted HTH domain antitoxin